LGGGKYRHGVRAEQEIGDTSKVRRGKGMKRNKSKRGKTLGQ